MIYELRSVIEPIEFRSDEGRLVASGVAMKYGARSKPIMHKTKGVFRETFRAGSLAKTIQESDVRSYNEHDGPYLGRSKAGSLRLHDGPDALRYELDLPDTSAGRDAAVLLERGDIQGSSIGFRSLPQTDVWTIEDGMALRTVTEARLGRVDLTTAPAYDDSTAEMALRSLAEAQHLDYDEVMAAADAGDLRSLLERDPLGALLTPDEARALEEDGRETPTVRPHITHLLV